MHINTVHTHILCKEKLILDEINHMTAQKKTPQIKFFVLLAPLNPAVFENKNAWIKCLISWDWQIN